MLWFIIIVLAVLWALGYFAVHIAGGFIHLLIIVALVLFIYRLVKGDKVV